MRPSFSVSIAILYPLPTSPSTFSFGTRQSSRISSQVEEARIPSLSSFLPTVNPGKLFSIRNAVIPLYPFDASTVANRMNNPASLPFVIQSLRPLRTKSFPLSSALVCSANASDPDPASLNAYAPTVSAAIFGRQSFFWSSVAQRRIAFATSVFCTSTITPAEASARENSSTARIASKNLPPAPPYCSGISIPISPSEKAGGSGPFRRRPFRPSLSPADEPSVQRTGGCCHGRESRLL